MDPLSHLFTTIPMNWSLRLESMLKMGYIPHSTFTPAEGLAKVMEEDCRAMVQILHAHGLLLDLPEPTLDRCIGTLDRVELYADQIRRRSTAAHHTESLMTSVKQIKRMASLPDGAAVAMECLAEAAEAYLFSLAEEGYGFDNVEDEGVEEVAQHMRDITNLMDELIRKHYAACTRRRQVWDPTELREQLEAVLRNYLPVGSPDSGFHDPHHDCPLFRSSIKLLHTVVGRRAAEVTVEKSVAHVLPVEVVAMIKNVVCSDDRLTLGGQPRTAVR